jgi:hypothetical protein
MNKEQFMEPRRRRVRRPWWVKLGLWGLETRVAAQVFFWPAVGLGCAFFGVSILLAIAGVDSAYWVSLLLAAIMIGLAGFWYGAAIRWMDRHDRWI